MYFFYFVAVLCALFYVVLTTWCAKYWINHKSTSEFTNRKTLVSIIIVARNEANNIWRCLQSINSNDYPIDQYEIILMDDHSTDGTPELAQQTGIPNLRVLSLSDYDLSSIDGAFKKAGLQWAIKEAQYDLVLQTDGDCLVPKRWISTMTHALGNADIVTSAIHISSDKSILSRWQTFDMIGTMAMTHLGMGTKLWQSGNAANMAFKKRIFNTYHKEARQSLASGDDVFFINWAHQNNYKTKYLHNLDTIVETRPEPNIKQLYQQRLRWATKTSSYRNNGLKWFMAGMFIFHSLILISGILLLIHYSFSLLVVFGILVGSKWIGDFVLLSTASGFFKDRYRILFSPILSIMHIAYVVVIGTSALLFRRYQWKGRKVS